MPAPNTRDQEEVSRVNVAALKIPYEDRQPPQVSGDNEAISGTYYFLKGRFFYYGNPRGEQA